MPPKKNLSDPAKITSIDADQIIGVTDHLAKGVQQAGDPRLIVAGETDPYPLPSVKQVKNAGWDSVLFIEGLQYITEQSNKHEAWRRFHQFLVEGKKWSEEQVNHFIFDRNDRWPPLRRVIGSNDPRGIDTPGPDDTFHRSSIVEQIWHDYGGFRLEELPTLKAVYTKWYQAQSDSKRAQNLRAKKKSAKT